MFPYTFLSYDAANSLPQKRKPDDEVLQESLPKDGNRHPMKRQRLNDYARKVTEIKCWSGASGVQREMARLAGEKWAEGQYMRVKERPPI